MRTARGVIGLAALAVSVWNLGCSLPERDNPRDPAIAPSARLTLRDPVTQITSNDLVAPWNHRIELDASGSTDDQDDIESCTFTIIDVATGSEIGSPPGDSCVTGLGPALSPNTAVNTAGLLALGTKYEVRVTVRDARGNTGENPDPAYFTLTNLEPVADAGYSRTLPAAGLPWEPGAQVDVVFDGSGSSDPDGGDASGLVYCWTLVTNGTSGAEDCGSDPTLTVTVDLDGNTTNLLGRLRVHDGLTFSRTRNARVTFREPNLWSAPLGPGPLERVDTIHRGGSWGDENQFIPAAEVITAQGEPLVAIVADVNTDGLFDSNRDNELFVIQPPLDSKTSYVPIAAAGLEGTGYSAVGADPRGNGTIWVRTQGMPIAAFTSVDTSLCPTGPCDYLSSYEVTAPDAATPVRLVALPYRLGEDREGGQLVVDGAGNVFLAAQFGTTLTVVGPTPAESSANVLPDDPGEADKIIAALAPRPGTNETWVLLGGIFTGQIEMELRIYEGTQLVRSANILDFSLAFGLGWIDPSEFWLGHPEQGMGRFNADVVEALAAQGPFNLADARLQLVEDFIDVGEILANPVTGECWVSGIATGDLTLLSPDGDTTVFDLAGEDSSTPQFVDVTGALWHSPRRTLHQAFAPGETGILGVVPFHPAGSVEYDYETGGVWFTTFVPPAIVRIAEDGTILRYDSSMSLDGGAPVAFPFPAYTRVSPGRETAWIGASNPLSGQFLGVLRLDLTTGGPIQATSFLDAATALEIRDNGVVFEPFSPAGGMAHRIWTVLDGVTAPELVVLGTDGQPTTVFTFPAAEIDADGAPAQIHAVRSLETNDLCVATFEDVDGAPNVVHLRLARESGAVEELAAIPVQDAGAEGEVAAVAATMDAGRVVCWVGLNDSVMGVGDVARIRAFRDEAGPGTLVQSYDTPGSSPFGGERLGSIVPFALDDVWASIERRPIPSEPYVTFRVELTDSGAGLEETVTLAPTVRSILVAPWARSEADDPFN